MNYAEAIAHLYSLGQELVTAPGTGERRKFDLAHMRCLASALGDPQDRVPSVLIAGTNGKGSTAATLASILTAAGYRTGLYTSPHLMRVNERVKMARLALPSEYGNAGIRGSEGQLILREIQDEEFARLYTRVWTVSEMLVGAGTLPHLPSFFELLTTVAFSWFSERDAEIMVLEVGLGGRLDATNIVQPLLSIITDISFDHQDYLGSTLSEITREKCGILRKKGRLVTLPQHPEVNQAIGEAATALEVEAFNAAAYVPAPVRGERSRNDTDPFGRNRYVIRQDDGGPAVHVDSPLSGQHQQRNIALALAAAEVLREKSGFGLPTEALEEGIRSTVWPGRLEFIDERTLLDVAHNPAGAWTLRSFIARFSEETPRTLIFSCLRDKDLAEMSKILFPLFDASAGGDRHRRWDHIVLAPVRNPRAASIQHLSTAARELDVPFHAAESVAAAFMYARAVTPPQGVIVVTGSVYLVGEVRELAMRHSLADAVR